MSWNPDTWSAKRFLITGIILTAPLWLIVMAIIIAVFIYAPIVPIVLAALISGLVGLFFLGIWWEERKAR